LLCVSSTARHPDLGWELVQTLAAPEFMTTWGVHVGAPPAHDVGGFWDQYADVPFIETLRQTVRDARPYAVHPLWRSVEQRLAAGVGDMLWGLLHGLAPDAVREVGQAVDAKIEQLVRLSWGGVV
jgi:ABC-type glycerol-3-phosphate transport system substrate-binding protein